MTEHSQHPEPHIPDALHTDLRALYEPPGGVPATVSARVLNRARAQFARPRGSRRLLLRWAGAAAAAAIALAVWVAWPDRTPSPQVAVIAGDVNRDGRVDILDALLLARKIEEDRIPDNGRWLDLNNDGVIDERDVNAIALAAVSLERGGVQ